MDAPSAYPLRPLGVGEIFDRAVTIYVRNFATFSLIVLTLLAPYGVARFLVMPDQSALVRMISKMGDAKAGIPPNFYSMIGGLLVLIFVVSLLTPIVNNAVAVGVASLYSGTSPSYTHCFRTALSRWAPLLGALVLNLLMFLGAYLGVVVLLSILVGIGAALVSSALPVAVVVFIVAGVTTLGVLFLFLLMALGASFSLYSTAIEGLGPIEAVSRGYGRIFNRVELKKAFFIALAFLGVEVGTIVMLAAVGAVVTLVTNNTAVLIAVDTIGTTVLSAFITILLAVYYYDVRTRAEGLDLEVDLSRLTQAP